MSSTGIFKIGKTGTLKGTPYGKKTCTGVLTVPAVYDGIKVKTIGVDAFREFKKITSVIIEEGIEVINDLAFCLCSELKSVVIPSSVKKIGVCLFNGSDIEKIEVDKANKVFKSVDNCILQIKDNVLSHGCKSSIIPEYTAEIATEAFSDCEKLQAIDIPYGVSKIGKFAFILCSDLKEIIIPDSVTEIEKEAFKGSGLESVKLPKNLVKMGFFVFRDCKNLKNVEIPDGIKEISYHAFWNCGLTSIKIPKSVTKIEVCAFVCCHDLVKIEIDKENPVYKSVDNCIVRKEDNVLTHGSNTPIIPNFITEIGIGAFYACNFKHIEIPHGVSKIAHSAFTGCKNLKSIIIPDSVITIKSDPANHYLDETDKNLKMAVSTPFRNCENLTIYAVADSKPDGWDKSWNIGRFDELPVVWGYKGETIPK